MKGVLESIFDRWALPLASTLPLKDLENALGSENPLRIAVDAEHFLRKFSGKEPLNGALGGDPYLLEDKIMTELNQLKKLNCDTIFFFHGVEWGSTPDPIGAANKAAEINNSAFSKYEENAPKEAIEIFRNNGPILLWLKSILAKHGISSMTSPFSAYAQMVDAFNKGSVDMYFASTEIFLFGAGQIITSMDVKVDNHKTTGTSGEETTVQAVNVDSSTFKLLDLEILSSSHLHTSETIVKDAMVLTGSSKLPVFRPWADATATSTFTFADAANLLNRWDDNVYGLIDSSAIDNKSNYWDKFMQVTTAIQFMPVLHHINEVIPAGRRKDIPNDLQTALGVHLPDELNYYLFMGLISPKTLNWLNTGRITVKAPFEGGDHIFKRLVKDVQHDWRRQNYSLLVSNMQRYFQKRPVTTDYFFESSTDNAFTDETPAVDRSLLAQWRVREKEIASKSTALGLEPGTLLFAIESLLDAGFAGRTIQPKAIEPDVEPLSSRNELVSNVVWRGLCVRGYVDKGHRLTPWGKFARSALAKSGKTTEQNEAVFLAVELLRAKALSPKAILGPVKIEDKDRRYTEFVSRVMCVGSLVHQTKGYSGPLSRSLLAFHASVSSVRSSLRDLLEATLVNLLLWGEGERIRDDYTEITRDLPFQGRNSCGLGIFIQTYLDQYHKKAKESDSAATINDELKSLMQSFVAHCQVGPSCERINQIWDSLMAGVKANGDLLDKEDQEHFRDIDAWFSQRRPGTNNPIVMNGS